MACIRKYYGNDLQPSVLFNQLTEQFGEARGEEMYLLSKKIVIQGDTNAQGEPTLEAVLNANLKIIKKSKVPAVDIYDNLVNSRKGIEFRDDNDEHEYWVDGVKLTSVSEFTDKDVPYSGSKTDFDYSKEGTKYHGVLEDIVNKKGTNEEIASGRGLTPAEAAIIPYLRNFIGTLKGHVIPEFRIAMVDKKLAGTVDLVHIRPDGKVDIYDLKTVFQSTGRKKLGKQAWDIYETSGGTSNYKAQRYALQTSYYRYAMENGDAHTNRRGVEVDNVYIIPIEILSDDGIIATGVVARPIENINSWQKGKINFASAAEQKVRFRLGDKNTTTVSELKGYDTPSSLTGFVNSVLPKEPLSDSDLTRKATAYAENPKNEDGFRIRGAFYRWNGTSRAEKIARVKEIMTQSEDVAGTELTRAAVLTASGAVGGYFAQNKEASNQLEQILNEASANKVIALSSIKGFEAYSDVMVILRKDGTADLIKMTFDDLTQTVKVANEYKNTIRKTLVGTTGSIVGNHMTYEQAFQNGITLQNNLGDRERLRLAMIAMEVKNANVDFKVNRILVQSFASNTLTSPQAVLLSDVLPQVKAIYDIPQLKTSVAGRLKEILDNNELYIADRYQQDPAKQYLDYLQNNFKDTDFMDPVTTKKNTRFFNMKLLEKYVNGELKKDQLIERLIMNERGLRDIIRSKYHGNENDIEYNIQRDPEFIMLSRTIITLKDGKLYPEQDVSEGFLGTVTKYLASPTKTGRQTLDMAIDEFRKGLDTVKNEVTKFVEDKKPVLQALIDDNPVWKGSIKLGGKTVVSTDTLTGMGQAVFNPLFQTRKTAEGKEYKIPFLIPEKSPEFYKLTPAQQRAITWFNDQFEKWFDEGHPFEDAQGNKIHKWVRGMVPVLTTSPNTALYKAKENLTKGDLKGVKNAMQNFVMRSYAILGNYGNFQSPDKAQKRDRAYDYFIRQINGVDNTMATYTLESIGLDENMTLTDPVKNGYFETDLEEVVNQFMSHNVKKREMDKRIPIGRFYQSVFKYYEQAFFMKQTDSMMLLDNFINDNVYGEKIGAESEVTKVLTASIGMSSIMLLGLNWKVFTANGMQMGLSGLNNAMVAQFSGDKRFPGLGDLAKAGKEMMKMSDPINGAAQAQRIDMLLELYMPEDITQLKQRRYKVTQRGIIDSQTAFAIDRLIERGYRAHYLIAQMIKDGTYDAHTVERYEGKDGLMRVRIVYDENKDERFKNNPLLKKAVKEALTHEELGLSGDDGELLDNRKMLKAYDWRYRQKYKSYADSMFSSMDKDLKSEYAHYGLFGGFSQFRSWFRDKLVKATKREYSNMVTGDLVLVNGEYVWSNEPYKGILWTLADIFSIADNVIKDKNFNNVSKADKENLLLAVNSLAMWSLLAMLINAAFDDEDDPTQVMAKAVMMKGIQDLTSSLTLLPLLNIIDDPFIFASYYKNLASNMVKSTGYAADGETEKAARIVMDSLPVMREIEDFI